MDRRAAAAVELRKNMEKRKVFVATPLQVG